MAGTKVRGITIELSADASGVSGALKQINSALKTTQSDLRDIDKLLKLDPSNTELLAQKYKTLQTQLDNTKNKLDQLKKAEADLQASMVDGGTEGQQRQLAALQREIISCEVDIKKYNKALEETTSTSEDAAKATDNVANKFDGIGQVCAKIGTAMTAAMAVVGAASAALAKEVISAYGEIEQLEGGVQKIFGDDATKVVENAANAYKTVGVSAAEYMETVTSFSAAMIQSLGGDTAKAVGYADQALQDMADNANTFGTDIASIQNAYQGFAKQNYTMLDNLKLGYGGTKTEMERLIADANKVKQANGEMANLSIESFADVTEAIHVMQTEMGIAGTTSAEAEHTIEGSLNALKASWQNLMAGLGDSDADIQKLAGNVATSFENVVNNIVPVVANIISALPTLISAVINAMTSMAPQLITTVVNLFKQVLNTIVTALPELIPVIVEGVMLMAQTLLDNLPLIIEAAMQIIVSIMTGIANMLPELIPTIIEVVQTMITTLLEHLDEIIEAAIQIMVALIMGLIEALPQLIAYLPTIVTAIVNTLIDNIDLIIEAGVQLLIALIINLPKAIIEIVKAIPQIIVAIVKAVGEGVSKMAEAGLNLLKGLWQGISSGISWLWNKIKGWLSNLWDSILGFFGIHSPSKEMEWVGEMLVEGLAGGIEDTGDEAVNAANAMVEDVNNAMNGLLNPSVSADVNSTLTMKTNTADNSANINKLVALFDEYLPTLNNMAMYLDSGELVGAVAPKMSKEFGRLDTLALRGAY